MSQNLRLGDKVRINLKPREHYDKLNLQVPYYQSDKEEGTIMNMLGGIRDNDRNIMVSIESTKHILHIAYYPFELQKIQTKTEKIRKELLGEK